MWPKMLFELLPHAGRLIPVAEKFFATRGARDQEEQAALAALGETVRTELARAAEGNANLERAVRGQAELVSGLATELTRSRTGFDSLEERVSSLEKTVHAAEATSKRVQSLVMIVVGLLVAVLALLVFFAVKVGSR